MEPQFWALTFIMIWIPWSFDNQIIIFIHFVISLCLFDTMLTLVILCWMALMPEITSDIDIRNKINFFMLLFGFFGLLPFIILMPGIKEAGLQPFQIANIIIAIISIICYWIVALTNKEKPEFKKDEVFPLWKSIKKTLKLKSFLLYIGYNFCCTFKNSIGLSYLFVYVLILGGKVTEAMGLFLIIYMPLGYFSNIICMKLRPKWGTRNIILRFGLLQVILSIVLFFIILNPQTESLIWFGLIGTTFFGGYGVFTIPMMALSMDEDEVKHGTRREGIFLGLNALFTKPADSLGPITATIILETYGYLKGFFLLKDSPFQFPGALFGIKFLFLIVPAILSLISFLFMYFYPLHGERLIELESKLEKLHQEKREKLAHNT